ncbi:hypothetical protein Aph02nite_45260 [Actinoplanes philippinensis]|uniref:Uncharacterized protein n=1 Tax=Actinoplanes philippinensis TaxID=35752 RepID=A0A1I2I815_9ACTN|nr:hypothetical protein [Actinoplanes philippinensis]GIE78576.1 hypothetical protein Aph02nite_45260 [Actinoplanes philippinensis]SFF37778.1 hypothetical protein SAMN05421541_109354 [Actinoplanes philippinensis]
MDKELDDRESARVRAARFGKLPARIHPDSTVETVGTTSPQSRPDAAGSEEQRQVFLAGG